MRKVIVEAAVRVMIEVEDDETAEDIARMNNNSGHGLEDGCSICAFNLLESNSLGLLQLRSLRYIREASDKDIKHYTAPPMPLGIEDTLQ